MVVKVGDEVERRCYRLEGIFAVTIEVSEGESQYVKSSAEAGTGQVKDERSPLSEIIEVPKGGKVHELRLAMVELDPTMTTKAVLHRLIDAIPERDLDAARLALQPLVDPVLLALVNFPEDDEPLSVEEEAMVTESWAAYRRDEYLSDAQLSEQLKRGGE